MNLPLSGWADYLLCHPHGATVYEISRTEPFRLMRTRQAHDTPVTPPLMGRTVNTVMGILEPEQPGLAARLIQALRNVRVNEPIRLEYRSSRHGAVRVALIVDEGPEHPYLTIFCDPLPPAER
jgi:hypothetical protein